MLPRSPGGCHGLPKRFGCADPCSRAVDAYRVSHAMKAFLVDAMAIILPKLGAVPRIVH